MITKKCSVCHELKAIDQFSKSRSKSDGHHSRCKQCDSAHGRAWYEANKERNHSRSRRFAAENPGRAAEYARRYRKRHPERIRASDERAREETRARGRRWFEANKEAKRAKNREWAKNNPVAHAANCARRRASELTATPGWADRGKIQAIYAEARRLTERTGIVHHVDHVIPLRGKAISGLHVETNLQIITAERNKMKSNRFDGNS